MGASYAFSVIGWQGTAVGGGRTEDARISTAVKYRVDVGDWFRLGAIYQVGGYDQNNATQGEWGAQIGKDINFGAYGKLSLDAIYTVDKGAVTSSPLTAAQNLLFPGTHRGNDLRRQQRDAAGQVHLSQGSKCTAATNTSRSQTPAHR